MTGTSDIWRRASILFAIDFHGRIDEGRGGAYYFLCHKARAVPERDLFRQSLTCLDRRNDSTYSGSNGSLVILSLLPPSFHPIPFPKTQRQNQDEQHRTHLERRIRCPAEQPTNVSAHDIFQDGQVSSTKALLRLQIGHHVRRPLGATAEFIPFTWTHLRTPYQCDQEITP